MGYRTPTSTGSPPRARSSRTGTASRAARRAVPRSSRTVAIRTGSPRSACRARPRDDEEDPTIATLLKAQGYVTGQFGKNHLGDRDEMLPTNHGFDDSSAISITEREEEPENPDYPKSPEFKKKFGREASSTALRAPDRGHGPLTKKRMETIDDEVTAAALKSWTRPRRTASRSSCGGTPRGCISSPSEEGVRGQDRPRRLRRRDGRARRPRRSGARQAQGAGLDENTIVMYSPTTAPRLHVARRRHDDVPRREEHAVEGGYRVRR